jgi:hypothetical protein
MNQPNAKTPSTPNAEVRCAIYTRKSTLALARGDRLQNAKPPGAALSNSP